jgi:hypothetical protein
MLSLSAESICLVDGKQNIIQPMVPAEQGFSHFNNLLCYVLYKEKDDKGIAAFSIVLSKNLSITALLDRDFPAIAATNNQPMQYVTTKTVAYIFALVIECVTVFRQASPYSHTLQHEASILKDIDSMPPDDFRTELCGSLTDFYENILKKAGAGRRRPCPASSSPKLHPYQHPTPLPALTATTTISWYLEPTLTPLRRRRALRRRKQQRPPPRCGSATDASPGAACWQRRWQAQDFLMKHA